MFKGGKTYTCFRYFTCELAKVALEFIIFKKVLNLKYIFCCKNRCNKFCSGGPRPGLRSQPLLVSGIILSFIYMYE